MRDLPDLLRAGDLLVFNDTRVIPARLFGQKASGGRVEILIERAARRRTRCARSSARASRPKAGVAHRCSTPAARPRCSGATASSTACASTSPESLEQWLLHAGRLPLPPYIQRDAGSDDDARYQTVFAREAGAVAAPTAGLHFDEALLQALARARRASSATSPCTSARARSSRCASTTSAEHVMHSEWLNVGAALVEQIAAHARRRRPRDRGRHDRGARARSERA